MIINFQLAVLQHRISIPKKILEVPQVGETRFLALLPPLRPRPSLHVIIDPNIFRMFRAYWKCKHVPQNFKHGQSILKYFEVPPSSRLDFCRTLPGLRPRLSPSFASTAAPFDERSSAAATWPYFAAKCSGVQPQALSGNAELHRHNDKRRTNVLDSTSSKLFKAKTFTNTLNKFQYIFGTTLPLMKRCVVENVQRTDKASLNNVFKYIGDNMVCCDIFSCLVLSPELHVLISLWLLKQMHFTSKH